MRQHELISLWNHAFELCVTEGECEYYLIDYKAVIPLPCRGKVASLIERRNWFRLPYTFIAEQPILLLDKVEKLMEVWRDAGKASLCQFRAKTLFAHRGAAGKSQKAAGQQGSDGSTMRLSRYAADRMLFIVDYVDEFDATMAEMNKSTVWRSLNAVKAQRVFPLNVSIDTQGPLAIEYTIKQLLHFLAQ